MTRRRGSAVWLAAAGGLLVSLFAPGLLAFPTSRLVYGRGPGAEQCPDQDAVRAAVASRLGYDPFFPNADKTIVARILRDEHGLRAVLELVDEHGARVGQRELTAEADECAQLVRALALSISIAIDPKSAETYAQGPADVPAEEPPKAEPEAPKAEPETPAPPRTPALPAPAKRPMPPVAPGSAPALRVSAGLSAMGVLGDAPKPTLAGAVFVRLRRAEWSLALEASADLPVTDRRDPTPPATSSDVHFRTSRYALRALPCFHWGAAFACEVTAVDFLNAKGTAAVGKSGTGVLLMLGGRVGAELRLSPSVGLLGQAEMLVSPWTVQLKSEGYPLWRSSSLSAGAGLGVALHFR